MRACAVLTGWHVSGEEAHRSRAQRVTIKVSERELARVPNAPELRGVGPRAAPEGVAFVHEYAMRAVRRTRLRERV